MNGSQHGMLFPRGLGGFWCHTECVACSGDCKDYSCHNDSSGVWFSDILAELFSCNSWAVWWSGWVGVTSSGKSIAWHKEDPRLLWFHSDPGAGLISNKDGAEVSWNCVTPVDFWGHTEEVMHLENLVEAHHKLIACFFSMVVVVLEELVVNFFLGVMSSPSLSYSRCHLFRLLKFQQKSPKVYLH